MKYQIMFSGKIKKTVTKLSSVEFAHRVVIQEDKTSNGLIKRKRAFEDAQNAQIQIILRIF